MLELILLHKPYLVAVLLRYENQTTYISTITHFYVFVLWFYLWSGNRSQKGVLG